MLQQSSSFFKSRKKIKDKNLKDKKKRKFEKKGEEGHQCFTISTNLYLRSKIPSE